MVLSSSSPTTAAAPWRSICLLHPAFPSSLPAYVGIQVYLGQAGILSHRKVHISTFPAAWAKRFSSAIWALTPYFFAVCYPAAHWRTRNLPCVCLTAAVPATCASGRMIGSGFMWWGSCAAKFLYFTGRHQVTGTGSRSPPCLTAFPAPISVPPSSGPKICSTSSSPIEATIVSPFLPCAEITCCTERISAAPEGGCPGILAYLAPIWW